MYYCPLLSLHAATILKWGTQASPERQHGDAF